MSTPDVAATRERILESAYGLATDVGLTQATVEGVAHEAGLSRATIYRHFPGGKDELVEAVVSWEVARFVTRMMEETEAAVDFTDWLTRGLLAARRQMDQHRLLQRLLQDEADQLVPRLVAVMPIILAVLREAIVDQLAAAELRPGVDRGEAADILARLLMSYIGTPGAWQLDDPAEARRLVQSLVAGVLA
jgi:AcrR family transcriptional regulator